MNSIPAGANFFCGQSNCCCCCGSWVVGPWGARASTLSWDPFRRLETLVRVRSLVAPATCCTSAHPKFTWFAGLWRWGVQQWKAFLWLRSSLFVWTPKKNQCYEYGVRYPLEISAPAADLNVQTHTLAATSIHMVSSTVPTLRLKLLAQHAYSLYMPNSKALQYTRCWLIWLDLASIILIWDKVKNMWRSSYE